MQSARLEPQPGRNTEGELCSEFSEQLTPKNEKRAVFEKILCEERGKTWPQMVPIFNKTEMIIQRVRFTVDTTEAQTSAFPEKNQILLLQMPRFPCNGI